jgi:hypothetical protein
MNRPTGITFTGVGIVLALTMWRSCAEAQTADPKLNKLMTFANNFSHENAICGAYALFVHQCLKNKDAADPVAKRYFDLGDDYLKRSQSSGKIAGVSQKALSARVDLAIEELKSDTENNCVNIAVLFQKHAQSCKTLYEDGPAQLLRATEQMK